MVTNGIILICAVIFVYINFIAKGDKTTTALRLGAFYPPYISERRQYYRFLTCHFIHIDFLHFFMNIYAIYAMGRFFESLLGTTFYVLLVLCSMIASSAMTYSMANYSPRYENTVTIGASGIFYGYLGALIALALLFGGAYLNLLYNFAFVIILNLFFTLTNPQISKTGHLGGLLGGIIAIVGLRFVGLL